MDRACALVEGFLGRGGKDHRARTLADILAWPDAKLESEHDFIQWLFPMDTPSPVNPSAPTPTREEFATLAAQPAVLDGCRSAFARMLSFYGLRRDADGRVVKADHWRTRRTDWATQATHNDLRISRILRSLSLFGLDDEARAFLAALEGLMLECRGAERVTPLRFWRAAASP